MGTGGPVAAALGLLALPALASSFAAPPPAVAVPSQRSPRPYHRTSLPAKMPRFNPFGMAGDVASSLLSGGGGPADAEFDREISSLVGPGWEEIRARLEAVQTDEERRFRSDVAKGHGRGSPLNAIRLYDEANTEQDVRVTFYRDHASWCPYCHKVWMCLEEKKIPYRVEKINMRCYGEKPAEFRRLQPSGAIPVAIIDGRVYGQSNDIIYALERLFPGHKSLSATGEEDRERARRLLRLERQLFSAWMGWLTAGFGKDGFLRSLDEVEAELKSSRGGDFFLGGDVTLVDFMFAPFLERMAASLIYFKGFQFRVAPGAKTKWPAINKWFDAMETLESYRLTKSDYYTHCWDLPPQLGGCSYERGGEPFEAAINGGSWNLPLEKDCGGIEPDWTWCGDEGAARREAAERLSHNHENIVKFASRGAGRKGMPPYGAPLSDPNAAPSEAVLASVDAGLRLVSLALLEGTEAHGDAAGAFADQLTRNGRGAGHAEDVVKSLSYLRDRVGVPRDMRLPAARQLRAHLNWLVGAVAAA